MRYSKLRMLEQAFRQLVKNQKLEIETSRIEEFKQGQKVRVLCVRESDFKPNGIHWHGEVENVTPCKINSGIIESVNVTLLPITLECNNPRLF